MEPKGKFRKTHANMFGIDESADVDTDIPVNRGYQEKSVFEGKIFHVGVEIKKQLVLL